MQKTTNAQIPKKNPKTKMNKIQKYKKQKCNNIKKEIAKNQPNFKISKKKR
jgi:hypothetical protein